MPCPTAAGGPLEDESSIEKAQSSMAANPFALPLRLA